MPAARVTAIVRELSEDTVDLSLADDAVWIKSEKSEFRLSAQDASEFPPVAEFDDERYFAIPGKVAPRRDQADGLRHRRGKLALRLGGRAARAGTGTKSRFAATDTRRLAVFEMPAVSQRSGARAENPAPVIPTKALSLIERSIPDAESEALLAIHPNEALVKVGSSTIYSRLVEGRFPKYRDVIPARAEKSIDLFVGPFYSAIRQAQIVTEEDSRGVDFRFATGLLTLTSKSADVGQSVIQLPISYDGARPGDLVRPAIHRRLSPRARAGEDRSAST